MYEVRGDLRAGPAAAPVLARVLALLCARAELGVDRVGDVLLASDTLCAAAGHLTDDRICVRTEARPGLLAVEIGPYPPGGAEAVLAGTRLDGFALLETLADDVAIVADGRLELLRLCFTRPA